MAASRIIEEESGIYRGHRIHRHNGYYAGDFSQSSRTGSERHGSHAAVAHQAQGPRHPADSPVVGL